LISRPVLRLILRRSDIRRFSLADSNFWLLC
jgi:hypothetical protein